MTHLWVRAEQRGNEKRVGITPEGAALLVENGFKITIEKCSSRILPIDGYKRAGCKIAKENSWPYAPNDAIIFGLKELPKETTPLNHRHIMFGHAYKGQNSGLPLLKRFKSGGGTLYDIEYLTDSIGRRVAAFGYWAGFAGAAVSLMVWLFQKKIRRWHPVKDYVDKASLVDELKKELNMVSTEIPNSIVIGALGRVGSGACDFCQTLGMKVTKWDIEETKNKEAFHQILDHDIFLNCILATKDTPVFLSKKDIKRSRKLSVIGDIACDPDSNYNPIPIYDTPTTWIEPSKNLLNKPPLSIMAIDNLPSLLPKESSIDFASQLLPYLKELDNLNKGVWYRAEKIFRDNIVGV